MYCINSIEIQQELLVKFSCDFHKSRLQEVDLVFFIFLFLFSFDSFSFILFLELGLGLE